jgi:hypothetical protein
VFFSNIKGTKEAKRNEEKWVENIFEFHCGNLFTNTAADEVKEKAVPEES